MEANTAFKNMGEDVRQRMCNIKGHVRECAKFPHCCSDCPPPPPLLNITEKKKDEKKIIALALRKEKKKSISA